jgi:hypothetical protein
MAIQRIHPRKCFAATPARVRLDVEMQCLVALAIVLPGEAL